MVDKSFRLTYANIISKIRIVSIQIARYTIAHKTDYFFLLSSLYYFFCSFSSMMVSMSWVIERAYRITRRHMNRIPFIIFVWIAFYKWTSDFKMLPYQCTRIKINGEEWEKGIKIKSKISISVLKWWYWYMSVFYIHNFLLFFFTILRLLPLSLNL